MYIETKFRSGTRARIVVRPETEKRLRKKSFRGQSCCCAGNFQRWASPDEMFETNLIYAEFLAVMQELWLMKDFGTHSFTVECDEVVGFENTTNADRFLPGELERHQLNKRAHCLRVKPSLVHIRAPVTEDITFVIEFKAEGKDGDIATAVIHSMYPGVDVGELSGDMTAREGRVWFDWDHSGA